MNISTPTTNTTYINGYNGNAPVYGTATTYGTKNTTVPVVVDRYDQSGMYLKNVSGLIPLWERVKEQYPKTSNNELSGIWKNESYQIEVYQSDNKMVAFIDKVLGGDNSWESGQLKMIFDQKSGEGIYLMGNKAPMPFNVSINKFGHLVVKLAISDVVFSFAKIP